MLVLPFVLACTPVPYHVTFHSPGGVTNAAVIFESNVSGFELVLVVTTSAGTSPVAGNLTQEHGLFVWRPAAPFPPGVSVVASAESPYWTAGSVTGTFGTGASADVDAPILADGVATDFLSFQENVPGTPCPMPPDHWATALDWADATDASAVLYVLGTAQGLATSAFFTSSVVRTTSEGEFDLVAGGAANLSVCAYDAAGNFACLGTESIAVPGEPGDPIVEGGCGCRLSAEHRPARSGRPAFGAHAAWLAALAALSFHRRRR